MSDWFVASFKATIDFSMKAMHSLGWIGGGTSVALLVFIERMYGNHQGLVVHYLRWALLCSFLVTLLSGVCYGLAYFAQSHFSCSKNEKAKRYNRWVILIQIACYVLLFVGGCIVFFGLGECFQ